MAPRTRGSLWMNLIGLEKLGEALLMFTVALGLHHLLRQDVAETVTRWTRAIRVDPDNRFAHRALGAITGLSRRRMQELSLGTLLYGTLFGAEGVGLLLKQRWAEYITLITTAGFLPVEGYELYHRFTVVKLIVALLNLLVVIYLFLRLRRQQLRDTHCETAAVISVPNL